MIYYQKYPEDVQRVKDIVRYLEKNNVILPLGGKLSVLRLRQLGWLFGFHGQCQDLALAHNIAD